MSGFGFDQMAILVRASHQMRAFEDRFLTIGMPYRVIGGPRFYERLEIRDAMAYFRIVSSPEDDLAFERIVEVLNNLMLSFSVNSRHAIVENDNIWVFNKRTGD